MIKGVTLVRFLYSLCIDSCCMPSLYSGITGVCSWDFFCLPDDCFLTVSAACCLFVNPVLTSLICLFDCRVSAIKCVQCTPISPSMWSFRRVGLWWRSGTSWERSTSAVSEWGKVSLLDMVMLKVWKWHACEESSYGFIHKYNNDDDFFVIFLDLARKKNLRDKLS